MQHCRVDYVIPKWLEMHRHPEFNEKWVQARIVDHPALLGLGDIEVKDEERRQPAAGRLDLLLADVEAGIRYEVELQLGSTDETHIIRTIEYWDFEKRRYPQYEHCAVIVAENITSRFLNVVALFNGFIPLIAIQLKAIEVNGTVALVATKVMDRLDLGTEEDDAGEAVDRNYWEQKAPKPIMKSVDGLLTIVREVTNDERLDLKYNKFYIGLARDGVPNNFVTARPQKKYLRIEPRIARSDEWDQRLDDAGLDLLDYGTRGGVYRIRLVPEDFQKNAEVIRELVFAAYETSGK